MNLLFQSTRSSTRLSNNVQERENHENQQEIVILVEFMLCRVVITDVSEVVPVELYLESLIPSRMLVANPSAVLVEWQVKSNTS